VGSTNLASQLDAEDWRNIVNAYLDESSKAVTALGGHVPRTVSSLGAGLFSVALSVAAVAFFVLPPTFSFYVEKPGDVLALLLYTVVMLFTVAVGAGMRFAVERRRDQQTLQASKDLLQFALEAARLGWWQYDPIHDIVLWDTRLKEMFDVAEDETDIEEFTRRVHPDDLERVWAAVEAALTPPIRSLTPPNFGTGGRTARSAGWMLTGLFISRAPGATNALSGWLAQLRTSQSVSCARNERAPAYARGQSSRQEHA
jgi:PAS domain-containing protein